MSSLATSPKPSKALAKAPPAVPPLRMGDHLDRATFHERYSAMPEDFRAELVRGVVYVSSPAHCPHGRMHASVLTWLGVFKSATRGVDVLDNTSTEIRDDNEYQPDAQMIVLPEYGGQGVQLGKLVTGAPHFVVEVAASSAAYDLFEKREEYEKAGVREYAVILVDEPAVRWFVLQKNQFAQVPSNADGVYRSAAFPGLWLHEEALLADDMAKVLSVLQTGLQSAEHAAFVQQLDAAHRAQQSASP